MAIYIDTRSWPRRDAFNHFAGFDQPFFSICTRVDVAPLKSALARRSPRGGLSLACHFIALQLANQHEAFRLRLEACGEQAKAKAKAKAEVRVRLHARVDASTTVLRADDSFGFADLPYVPRFAEFRACGAAALQAVRDGPPGFRPSTATATAPGDDASLMYFTTLPWVHFSSFAHARPGAAVLDSIPRVAFGRIDAEGSRQWMPVALDVHHALMDGLHAGRWLQALQDGLAAPQDWLD